MRKVLQVTFHYLGHELWLDLIDDIPPNINNLADFQLAAKQDFSENGRRKVRIVEIIED